MKIVDLYSGLGGNRKLWAGHEITAVEQDLSIGSAYAELYPEDAVVIGDAHEFLLQHYKDYDFIWSSPPCQSHGQYRYNVGVRAKGYKALYPDMKLYEEILFLKHYYQGHYVVENTKPFYKTLIEPTAKLGRHIFWSSFEIPSKDFGASNIHSKNKISDYTDFDITHTKISNKRQVLRNRVEPELGLYVLDCIPSNIKVDF